MRRAWNNSSVQLALCYVLPSLQVGVNVCDMRKLVLLTEQRQCRVL